MPLVNEDDIGPPAEAAPDSERTEVTLRYIGRDVDDGSIGVDDLLSALNGFSGAYYKLAERESLDVSQRIKVTGISKSSANVHLEILQWAAAHPVVSTVASGVGAAIAAKGTEIGKAATKKIAEVVINRMVNIAKAKKHIQRGNYTTEVTGDGNTVIIINGVNARLPVNQDDLKILEEGTIDNELDKMASPLREDSIDAFEIRHDQKEIPDLHIDAVDRPYFARQRREATVTQELMMTGMMASISKTTNSGTFITDTGRKIRFKLSEEARIPELYRQFAHLGPVRVKCKARLDDNLDVISIEISEVTPIQG